MARYSSGIMAYRWNGKMIEVLLVHPGGLLWKKRDRAAWSIPKGEFDPETEDPFSAAKREFHEETGFEVDGEPFFLGQLKQPGGKIVYAWALEADLDPERLTSNTFEMEWPRGSGRRRACPEVDRAAWFDTRTARDKLHKGLVPFLERLQRHLGRRDAKPSSRRRRVG